MLILVERSFELWERVVEIEHDTPVMGAYRTSTFSVKKYKEYETKSAAKRAMRILAKKYEEKGWKISKESTADQIILYLGWRDWRNIILSIREETQVVKEVKEIRDI